MSERYEAVPSGGAGAWVIRDVKGASTYALINPGPHHDAGAEARALAERMNDAAQPWYAEPGGAGDWNVADRRNSDRYMSTMGSLGPLEARELAERIADLLNADERGDDGR